MQEEFMESPKSGLLFISFQNDIRLFEEIKRNMNVNPNKSERQKVRLGVKEQYISTDASAKELFTPLTLGGGYYFIPPIPKKRISEIGQQFIDV